MSNIAYDYMEEYIRSLIPDNTGILKELEEYAEENSVPIIHKEVGNFLRFIISMKKPLKILEAGTAIGYSSILMCLAGNDIKIKTIEKDSAMVKLSRENIKKSGFSQNIQVIEGDCLQVLKELDEKFDMIFLDASKGHYNEIFDDCLKLLSDNGVIIGDNVLFRGMVASRKLLIRRKITIVKRMKLFLDRISKDGSLATTIIPMGDGISVTVRRN
ncbi:MAG: O-methyltransferase [Clostridiaceae bacterium]